MRDTELYRSCICPDAQISANIVPTGLGRAGNKLVKGRSRSRPARKRFEQAANRTRLAIACVLVAAHAARAEAQLDERRAGRSAHASEADSDVRALQGDSIPIAGTSAYKPMRYASTTVLDGFFERRHRGNGGTFITRGEIRRLPALDVMELLQRVAHAQVVVRGSGDVAVWFPRCRREYAHQSTAGEAIRSGAESTEPVTVYFNGMLFGHSAATLAGIAVDDIEAMEVHQGTSNQLAESYASSCATIFMWTRL
jgi:hypothetical protein